MVVFASALAALLIALLNGVMAIALAALARVNSRLWPAVPAPAGVAAFALIWFGTMVSPFLLWFGSSVPAAVGLAGIVAMSGFASEGWAAVPIRARYPVLLGVLVSTLVVATASVWFRRELTSTAVLPGSFATALVGLVWATYVLRRRDPDPAQRRFARHASLAMAAATVAAAALFFFNRVVLSGESRGVQATWVILIAEVLLFLQVIHQRVQMHVALTRTIGYALLATMVAVVTAAAFHQLGYPAHVGRILALLIVALAAASLFLALGDRLSAAVESVMFPGQARLNRQIAAAQGEHAALRRRLEQAERLAIAGELAASVGHEIKNPLAALRGYAELLAEGERHVDPAWRPAFAKAVRIIREEGDRIDARVAELLRQTRAGRPAAADAGADINHIVLEAVVVVEREPGVIEIATAMDPGLGRVAGNEEELRGAFCNLLKNAAEAHLPRAGRIEITTRRAEDRVVVEIRDEGRGLGGRRAEQLFRPFQSTKPGGTGLGLVIARSAIEAAGGTLAVLDRSDRPGALARVELLPSPAPSRSDGNEQHEIDRVAGRAHA
jgi:signal transduction histidine kinase